jgi:hypothetical protein
MREHPTAAWNIPDLMAALEFRGWLPDKKDAQKRVSDMASVMTNDGQLDRVERGVYRLSPKLALAFERRPTTDYRAAAALGFPVPERNPSDDKE